MADETKKETVKETSKDVLFDLEISRKSKKNNSLKQFIKMADDETYNSLKALTGSNGVFQYGEPNDLFSKLGIKYDSSKYDRNAERKASFDVDEVTSNGKLSVNKIKSLIQKNPDQVFKLKDLSIITVKKASRDYFRLVITDKVLKG